MKTEPANLIDGLDRLATASEIQAAVELCSECDAETGDAPALEIPSDRGGYVRILAEDFECASLISDLTQRVR